jgi:ribosomal protein S14
LVENLIFFFIIMAIYFTSKDKKFRILRAQAELRLLRLRFFLNSSRIYDLEKQKMNFLFLKRLGMLLPYSVRNKNRCVITSRSGSIFRYFKLSRIALKNSASLGFLTGVRKSS